MNKFEEDLLKDSSKLPWMNNLLYKHQFSEEFLIKTRGHYDSWKCLRTQSNLTPYFCFYWLYDRQEYDSADDWTDYNQVTEYLLENNWSLEEIEKEFSRAITDRENNEDYE